MTRTHYHVGYNMPGYLSENDPSIATSKRAAAAILVENVKAYQDMGCIEHGYSHKPYRQSGSAKSGDVWLEPRECVGGADYHHWWTPCQDEECEDYAEYLDK